MVFRRHKTLWQVLIAVIVVGTTLKFSYNYYTENELKLRAANVRHHELLERENKCSRELDGVIESKTNLELALRTKTQKFANIKKEWDTEKDNLENKANKLKSSFDALDSEYRMLKAKNDDLQIDYDHIKKSFDRLKEDHTKLDSEHRNNFAELKQKNEKIIVALQKQVEHYQNQENSLQFKVQKLQENVEQYQNVVATLQKKLDEGVTKKDPVAVSRINDAQKASNRVGQEMPQLKSRRRRLKKGLNPKNEVKKNLGHIYDTINNDKALKQKQFFQDLRKLGDESQETQNTKNEGDVEKSHNYIEMPKVNALKGDEVIGNERKKGIGEGGNGVNNIEKKVEVWKGPNDLDERKQEDKEGQTEENGVERKEENSDNIEVINKDGKDEQNLNLDEQQDLEAKERQALVEKSKDEETLQRDKREAAEQVNNDERSDDEEIALQGDNEDNTADDNEENEMLEQPENLLLKREEEAQDREENMKL